MTKTFLRFGLPIAIALAAGVAVAGTPKTPLGKWMQPNMGVPMGGEDYDTLKKSFDFVAGKSPGAEYPKWAIFSKTGSSAAAKQDLAGTKAACKSCHDAYKAKYIKDFPSTPFP
jgi:hypothetical protein